MRAILAAVVTVASMAAFGTGPAQAGQLGVVSAIHVAVAPKLAAKTHLFAERDLEFLQNELEGDVQERLEAAGLTGPGGARIDLTLVDAVAGRPTLQEMSENPDLSIESRRIGGATIEGAITYPDGHVRALAYRWYASDIRDEVAASTWSDAQEAFEAFAHDLAQGQDMARH